MPGNEFKLQINRSELAQIVENSKQFRITDQAFIKEAPYEDVMAAYTVLSLISFLEERRLRVDFELSLND